MDCKNCGSSLRSDFHYCPNCGAKVIRNRLTIKNIWQDLSYQVFDLDNTLLKTFRHLFTRADVVINTFISGARKKYMNPLSYFAIAITLSGFGAYILRNIYHIDMLDMGAANSSNANMDFLLDYQGVLNYLFMPIYAVLTWILFLDKQKFNYAEHLVVNAYLNAQVSITQFLLSIVLFGIWDFNYQTYNWIFLLTVIGFQFYILSKLHQISFISGVLRAIGYLFLFMIVMLGVGLVLAIIGLITGSLNLEDFKPKG